MSPLSLASMLPHELLVKIFYNLEERPQHRHSSTSSISFSLSLSLQRSDILVCALVCHDWYYAAVDTLWREVDLQSVETFIDFGRALDPDFSYLGTEPIRMYDRCHRINTTTNHNNSNNSSPIDDWMEGDGEEEKQDHDVDRKDIQLHSQGSTTSLSLLPTTSSSTKTTPIAILRRSQHSAQSLASSPSSTGSSSSLSSTSSSHSSYSFSSSTELSSLLCPQSPGPVGFAGKSYIRTLSLAGTSDCQGPRPFPYLPSCITDRHLISISNSLTHLTSLLLSHCVALTDVSVIQLVTLSSPYLQRIDLTECRLITNLTIQVLSQLCHRQLEDLCLHSCGLITDEAIEELAHRCSRLQRIDLGKCPRLSDRSLSVLLTNSGKLVELSPNEEGKSKFLRRARKARLTRLGVAGCRGISFAGLMAITEHLAGAAPSSTSCRGKEASTGDAISSLVSLEFTCPAPLQPSPPHPWMQQEFPTHSTSNISGTRPRPSQASRFFQTLPSTTLEEISIFEAYHLNHADILTLVERAGANLKSLKLDHARAIESETLKQVLSSCPRLEILTIPRAHRLTDAGVMQFVEANCAKSLVELDLSSCVGLTDECLTKLARGSAAVATAAARTLSLTSTIDRKGKGVAGTGDNKDKEAEHDHSLFPNLRRLDLSYNENMTLSGIIPLVMSLKNLCALDVSFCGDGVTTTWSSSLEALRPILNPTSDTEPEDSMSELIGPLQQGRIVEESEEDMDESGDAHDAAVEELGAATASQELSSHTAPTVLAGNTSPDVAAELTPISPIHSPGRHGLGGYSGPRLRSTTVTAIGHPVVTSSLPITTVSEGLLVMEDSRRRSSASSISSLSSCASDASTSSSASSSSTFSSVSSSSAGSSSTCCSSSSALSYSWVDTVSFAKGQSSNSRRTCALAASTNGNHEKQHHYHCRRRNSSLARIQLTARFDVLEVVPRRVGYGHGASYHLNSWFTPHHQQQLLQLFQIQVRQQHNLLMHQQRLLLLQQHQQYEQAATTVGSYDPCCDNDTILDTCDGHAATNFRSRGGVSVEEEAAAVLLELNEVLYLNTGVHPGQDANPIIHHNNNNNRSGRGGGRWRPNAEGTNEAAAGTGREGERGKGGIGGVDLARDYPGRHSINRRRTNLVAKGIVSLSGQCEISAWGLSLLKEEWSLV